MTRDDHRSPGRLAPPRPDYHWGTRASHTPGKRRPSGQRPNRRDDYQNGASRDDYYDDADDLSDLHYAEPEQNAPQPGAPPQEYAPGYRPRDYYAEDSIAAESADVMDYGYGSHANVHPAQAAEAGYYDPAPAMTRSPEYEPEPEVLTIQERHGLLMRTIELYDDEWKLASIRANENKNRLEAYLVPRNKHMELKEAIHRNKFMVITIDRLGNTSVKQPKRYGPLRRFTRWLFGD